MAFDFCTTKAVAEGSSVALWGLGSHRAATDPSNIRLGGTTSTNGVDGRIISGTAGFTARSGFGGFASNSSGIIDETSAKEEAKHVSDGDSDKRGDSEAAGGNGTAPTVGGSFVEGGRDISHPSKIRSEAANWLGTDRRSIDQGFRAVGVTWSDSAMDVKLSPSSLDPREVLLVALSPSPCSPLMIVSVSS